MICGDLILTLPNPFTILLITVTTKALGQQVEVKTNNIPVSANVT